MFLEPMDVDPFHLNQRSENTGLSLLLEGYNWRSGPGYGCLHVWPKVWSLYTLPKQQNTLSQNIDT